MITRVLEHEAIIGSVVTSIPGDEIERRRHELGWSQVQLAQRAKVSTRTVQTAERGEVSDRSYLRIVHALEDGEDQARRDVEPDMVTVHHTIEGLDGPITVTVTGRRESIRHLDFAALLDPLMRD